MGHRLCVLVVGLWLGVSVMTSARPAGAADDWSALSTTSSAWLGWLAREGDAPSISALDPSPRQAETQPWSVTFTPRVWFSRIERNLFGPLRVDRIGNGLNLAFNSFDLSAKNGRSTAAVDPQWGGLLTVKRGPWTIDAAAQYVSFETRYDITGLDRSQTLVQEFVKTSLLDLEMTLSHSWPNLIPGAELTIGGGARFTYATATRQFNNGIRDRFGSPTESWLYAVCGDNVNLADTNTCARRNRITADDYYYGATFPLGITFFPGRDRALSVPLRLSPFLGAETRDHHDVVYATQECPPVFGFFRCRSPKRLDGTTFAWGVTADAGLRYAIDDTVSVSGGMRVQYVKGFDPYLAWGPVVDMSIRFWDGDLAPTTGSPVAADTPEPTGDRWSIIFTPHVWFSHIEHNGFGPPQLGLLGTGGLPLDPNFLVVRSRPTSILDAQWGGQILMRKGAAAISAVAQYVSFETRNYLNRAEGLVDLPKGQTIVQEFVDTSRLDLELAFLYSLSPFRGATVTVGGGGKFIYATASRRFANGNPGYGFRIPGVNGPSLLYVYLVCPDGTELSSSGLARCSQRNRVTADDYYYGVTLPVSFSFFVDEDHTWTAPIKLSPFIGAETRNDHNVLYAVQQCGPDLGPSRTCQTPKRLDGTAFAYGVTAETGLRYDIDANLSVYGGLRVQYLKGLEPYLAWGPIVSLSVRFGK